jgi:hypothetical protein
MNVGFYIKVLVNDIIHRLHWRCGRRTHTVCNVPTHIVCKLIDLFVNNAISKRFNCTDTVFAQSGGCSVITQKSDNSSRDISNSHCFVSYSLQRLINQLNMTESEEIYAIRSRSSCLYFEQWEKFVTHTHCI